MPFIDLSHTFEDDMPGFTMRNPAGEPRHFTASVRPFLTHEASRPFYENRAEFEITEIRFQTSIGTYLDAPYHRHRDRRDIGALGLDELILPAIVVEVPGAEAGRPAPLGAVRLPDHGLAGHAVLFRFGWDRYWGKPEYEAYPFIGRDLMHALIARGVKLVGVDTFNIDERADLSRPVHTEFLKRDILIVENLTGLDRLPAAGFRFFAIPIKAKGAAALTIRAFAEVD